MPSRTLLLSVLLLAGCGGPSDTLNVQILPSAYSVGKVQSTLATPVVDEVVRLQPKKVHVSVCHSTPTAKHLQFITELQARSTATITGGFYENCPES